jgi:transcription termination/antitermination protein NusA
MQSADNEFALNQVISSVSKDKSLERAVIVEALEQAIIHAARRTLGIVADLEAHYNEDSDEIDLFQFRTVVEDDDVADDAIEVALADAQKLDPESILGDSIGIKIEARSFGRIAAMSAKQIIVQKVREAERTQIYEEFKDRVGEILGGNIRRFERSDMVVDLGKTEAVISSREQVPNEKFRIKDRVTGYVLEVKRSSRGPQIVMSRAHPGFVVALFEQNVSEIYDGIVTVESAARDPGFRSKIAVHSKDSSVDPVGACVGMKGARVQAVVQELNGEKIDIIPWDRDPARLVCNALAPAAVNKVIVDEERHSMEVVVADDQLSLAIGKRGQNVRLAAQLTGWRLDIKSESKLEEQMSGVRSALASIEGVGELRAKILLQEEISSPAILAETGSRSLMRILNLELEDAKAIIERAKNFQPNEQAPTADQMQTAELLANASAAPVVEEDPATKVPDRDIKAERVEIFLQLQNVGEASAHALAESGYGTIGDIIADTGEEVSHKTGLPISIARTIQIAADRFMQSQSERISHDDDE